jgi:hypothetical protein
MLWFPFGAIEEAIVWCGLLEGQVVLTINAGHAGSGSLLDLHLPIPLGTKACASMSNHFTTKTRCRDLIEINAPGV